jgi:hypothetical protein
MSVLDKGVIDIEEATIPTSVLVAMYMVGWYLFSFVATSGIGHGRCHEKYHGSPTDTH